MAPSGGVGVPKLLPSPTSQLWPCPVAVVWTGGVMGRWGPGLRTQGSPAHIHTHACAYTHSHAHTCALALHSSAGEGRRLSPERAPRAEASREGQTDPVWGQGKPSPEAAPRTEGVPLFTTSSRGRGCDPVAWLCLAPPHTIWPQGDRGPSRPCWKASAPSRHPDPAHTGPGLPTGWKRWGQRDAQKLPTERPQSPPPRCPRSAQKGPHRHNQPETLATQQVGPGRLSLARLPSEV